MQLNFTISELLHSDIAKKEKISNIANEHALDNMLQLIVNCLQPIRNYINKPMIITSGYRCEKLNSHPKIKGAKNSEHLTGCAADFVIHGMTPKQVVEKVQASDIPFRQLINEYDQWTHISFKQGENIRQVLYIQ